MPSGKRVRVANVGQVTEGQGHVVEHEGGSVAVFNVDGRYYAIDNLCPHRGGPLADGDLEGVVISCPWHAWRWDVTSGANVNNPAVKLACYPVIEEAGALFVELP